MHLSHQRLLYSVILLLGTVMFAASQCKLIDRSRDSVFITFEKSAPVTLDGEDRPQDGVILRLRNNSTCSVMIESGEAETFRKPLPVNPTPWQILHREIDYQLPDGVLVPSFQYVYNVRDQNRKSVGGDMFFGFILLGGRSLLFEVPLSHFPARFDSRIEVPFRYVWETENHAKSFYPSVKLSVEFYADGLPDDVKRKISSVSYPVKWFAPVDDPKKPDWEILPQEAELGQVILSKRSELGILSNFAATAFKYSGKQYASIEGFWQMMLYPEGPDDPRAKFPVLEWKYTREQVAQMTAFEAKSAGTLASANMKEMGIDWVTFDGKRFPYRSAEPGEHFRLITEAMQAKADQNPEVKRILLATGDLILKPDHHSDPDAPQEWKYYEIWMRIRIDLQHEQKSQ